MVLFLYFRHTHMYRKHTCATHVDESTQTLAIKVYLCLAKFFSSFPLPLFFLPLASPPFLRFFCYLCKWNVTIARNALRIAMSSFVGGNVSALKASLCADPLSCATPHGPSLSLLFPVMSMCYYYVFCFRAGFAGLRCFHYALAEICAS